MKTSKLQTAFAILFVALAVRVTLAQQPGMSVLAYGGPTHQFVEDPDGKGLIPVTPAMRVPGHIQPYGFLWTGYDATVEYDIYGVRRSQTPPGNFLDPLKLFSSSNCSPDGCNNGCSNSRPTIVNALSHMVKFRDSCPCNCNCNGCQVCDGERNAPAKQEADAKLPTPTPDQLPPNIIPEVEAASDDVPAAPVQVAPEVSDPPEPSHVIKPQRKSLPKNVLPQKSKVDDSTERSSRRKSKSRTVAAVGSFIKA